MTLKRRLIFHIFLLTAGVLLLGAAAIAGVYSLHQDFSVALRANEQLRQAYTVGQAVAAAREALTGRDTARASVEVARAAARFGLVEWLPATEMEADAVRKALRVARLTDPSDLDPSYAALADLSAATRRTIEARQASADRKQHLTLLTISALAGLLALAVVVVAARLYRAVMVPLGQLRATTRAFAASRLTPRAPTEADEEFASLARDFNRMADALHSLYADLEQRVDAKSRQLVRSERLASVGYLAAGVAHEINNPLAIIAGFAQRSLQRLGRTPHNEATAVQVRHALQTIVDESFRCKQITTRLLELARPGPAVRAPVALAVVTADVVSVVGGLSRFADRRITVDRAMEVDTTVLANEGELRQVILNLLVNALDATDPSVGAVHFRFSRVGVMVELAVTDNGRGISPEVLPQLFEPFFSDKRAERPGTGLGLSIAHAIATDHSGALDARSDGPGRGATFTLRLPSFVPEAAVV